jgi:DNA gyrase subunit A
MLALVDNEPQTLTLRAFLVTFLDFRIETVARRTRYQLRKAQERDHLLQGLLTALANLDAIIALIRRSADSAIAKVELIETYALSEFQSDAILQMQLRRLTALEAGKIEREHDDLMVQIADLEDILANRDRILTIITDEVAEIKKNHSTPRRTRIEQSETELMDEDLIANEKSVILITEQGYIKRMPVDSFDAQSRNTRGKAGAKMKVDDAIDHFITCCDHDVVMLFSDRGVVYALKAYQIPICSRIARGTPLVQLLQVTNKEKITSVVPVSEFRDDVYLVMLTKKGFIKKSALTAFGNIRANGLIAISLEEGDQLRWVSLATAADSIIVGSSQGRSIHFRVNNEQLRPLGRATRGVRSMNLKKDDSLVGMAIVSSQILAEYAALLEAGSDDETTEDLPEDKTRGPWILIVTTGGLGKRVPVSQFRLQNRGGMGIIATKFRKKGDTLAALTMVNEDEELMIVTHRGIIIRQLVNAISKQSRPATGVRLQRLDDSDAISAVAVVPLTGESAELDEDGEELDPDASDAIVDVDAVEEAIVAPDMADMDEDEA